MYEFKACRICLNIGVQMFELEGFLRDFLNELLGLKIIDADFLPHICYECAYLLKKFFKFKEKCLLGQNVLLEILQHNNQITEENILLVDRIHLKLASNLKISPVPAKSFYNFQHTAHCDDVEDKFYEENKEIISDEAGMSNDPADIPNDHTFLDEYDDESLPESEEKQDNENTLKADDTYFQIQCEDFDDDYDFFVKAAEDCVICRKKKDASELVKVQERGIDTLKRFSLLRNDGLFPLFNSVKIIDLHDTCRKKYTRSSKNGKYAPLKATDFLPKVKEPKSKKEKKIKKPKKKVSRPFDLPSSQDRKIDYKTNCFICLKDVTQESKKSFNRRDKVYTVTRPTSKNTYIRNLLEMKDSSPTYSNINENIERIKNLDLVNIGAVYHLSCYRKLDKRNSGSSSKKTGRPENSELVESMNLIYSYMEEMCDGSEFTLEELLGILPGYIPDKRTILRKLKDHFQDRINFTKGPKRLVIMLKY